MHDEAALLATIVADPQDSAPWLVYADFLDERGRPAGLFVRRFLRDLQALARTLPRAWPLWVEQVAGPDRCRFSGNPLGGADPDDVVGAADLESAPWPGIERDTRPPRVLTADGGMGDGPWMPDEPMEWES